MNTRTERRSITGPAGALVVALDRPPGTVRGLALVCHPHPLHGGTLDNKVVQTLARACVAQGLLSLRFNFRGADGSAGTWDGGRGEVDDAAAALQALQDEAGAGAGAALPLVLAGFSFGGHVAAALAARLAPTLVPQALLLVGPAVLNFQTPDVPKGSCVVHGEADDVVPLAAVLDWARPQALPVCVLPGAGHFFHGQLPLLKQVVTDALVARRLAGADA